MRKRFMISAILLFVIIAFFAFDVRLKTVEYIIDSEKLAGEIRLALVCDLHSCYYGEGQKNYFQKLKNINLMQCF